MGCEVEMGKKSRKWRQEEGIKRERNQEHERGGEGCGG